MAITASDGTDVIVTEEGSGPVVLVVHGGMSDESPWAKVAAELAPSYRVLRIRRRLYRPELPADPATDYRLEVGDVAAVVAGLPSRCLVVGHSSGAVVALEAMLELPDAFAGAVLYEPPIPDLPLGPPDALPRARAAVAAGRTGRAVEVFLREVVGIGRRTATVAGMAARFFPRTRSFAARQIDDWDALVRLGPRLDSYSAITTPTLLLTGDRSPAHLVERTRLLGAAMPHARIEVLTGHGHAANNTAPALVAGHIERFADEVGLDAPA